MRAAFIKRFDAEDPGSAVVVGDQPVPELPAEDWVMVDVRAASLNHHDIFTVRGGVTEAQDLPRVLGQDVAGVSTDGREVLVHTVINSPDWLGDETLDPEASGLGERYGGAFAEQVAVPRRNLVPKPPELSFEEAACLPTSWLTAYRMLFVQASVRPGDTVLVQGASGGVASACTALGAAAGLRMWVTGRTEPKRDFAVSLGAEATFEPGSRLPERVDAVIETVGEPTFAHSMKCTRKGGTIVVAGGTGGYVAPLRIDQLFVRSLRVVGSAMGTRKELASLTAFLVRTGVRPHIESVVSLDGVGAAITRMVGGDVTGKVVILPGA